MLYKILRSITSAFKEVGKASDIYAYYHYTLPLEEAKKANDIHTNNQISSKGSL
ncbi:hypothetical protein [Fangia hongkongensis]|uniref:hypothetical protein n=1 Tax=Fangia hongkongensis TaxID=270495 RepID=UPI00035DA51C|nr:hypothetical protein [Fangia hongkongensis]